MSSCLDHKTTFPDIHRHFRPAIEVSKNCHIACEGLFYFRKIASGGSHVGFGKNMNGAKYCNEDKFRTILLFFITVVSFWGPFAIEITYLSLLMLECLFGLHFLDSVIKGVNNKKDIYKYMYIYIYIYIY